MYETQQYSVVLLFNKDGSKVLLQTKAKTAYAGMLNGVGGKIKEAELPSKGALRKIEEETSLNAKDLLHFQWCGTLLVPEQCDETNPNKYPELWYFAGVVKDEELAKKPETAAEEIGWFELNGSKPCTGLNLAGNGDLEYFIGMGRRLLFETAVTK